MHILLTTTVQVYPENPVVIQNIFIKPFKMADHQKCHKCYNNKLDGWLRLNSTSSTSLLVFLHKIYITTTKYKKDVRHYAPVKQQPENSKR